MHGARNDCGKGYLSQMKEIWTLARGTGHLTVQDYYYYQLYDDSRHSPEDKRRFLSDRIHWPLTEKCCDVHWWATANDKLLAQTILEHAGAPLPVVQGAMPESW